MNSFIDVSSRTIQIQFKLKLQVQYGQIVMIVGTNFGRWDVQSGIEMCWQEGHEWVATQTFEIDNALTSKFTIEYKYVVVQWEDKKLVEWERGPNRRIETINSQEIVQIDHWNLRKVKLTLSTYKPQSYQCNILKINQAFQLEETAKNGSNKTFFLDIDQLMKGVNYLYSDQKQKWERGGSRKLSLLEFRNQKQSLKIENNVIKKIDNSLDFDLSYNQITDKVYVGSYLWDELDIMQLKSHGIDAVLNLQSVEDLNRRGLDPMKFQKLSQLCTANSILYLNYSITDRNDEDFYQRGIKAQSLLKKLVDTGRKVYVHCTAGIQRSVQTVLLYMVLQQHYTIEQALQMVYLKRPQAQVNVPLLRMQIANYKEKPSQRAIY